MNMASLNGPYDGLGIYPSTAVPFIIKSQNSPSFGPNVLNINGGHPGSNLGTAIIIYGSSYGEYAWNEVWMLTPDGRIICAFDDQIAIGLDPNDEYLVACVGSDPNDPSQQWTFEGSLGGYVIRNNQNNMVISAPPSQGTTFTSNYPQAGLSSLQGGATPEQYWQFFPTGPISSIAGKVYLQSALGGTLGSENPLVLSSYNNSAVIQSWVPYESYQLWLFNLNGSIANNSNYGLVLTSTSSSDQSDNQVTLSAPAGDNQTWTLDDNQLSVDVSGIGILYLNVNDSKTAENSAVITWEKTSGNNEIWYAFPAMPIDMGTCFYIQSSMSASDGNPTPFVLSVPGNAATAGVQLVIEPLVPGSLNQLWFMEDLGVITSAMNRTLALTANANSDNPVTLKAVQNNQPLQQWYIQSNGMVTMCLTDSGLVYLNVSGGGNASSGQGVITYTYATGSNATWSFPVYKPQPSGLWFTIRTCLKNAQNPKTCFLTASERGDVMVGPPSGGYALAEGQAGVNQLWRITTSGNVVSALNPNLGLTAGGANGLSLQPILGDAADQQWIWGTPVSMTLDSHGKSVNWPSAVLQNVGTGQVLWQTGNGYPYNALTLQSASSDQDTDNQLWYILPALPAYDQCTTIRNTSGTGLFLTLPAQPSNQTYTASLANRQGDPSLSTWTFTYPGYICSALDPGIVLSLEVDPSSSTGNAPVYTNNVCAYPLQPGLAPFQLWTATPDGLLVNQHNGMALTASNNAAPTGVTVAPLSKDPQTAMQVWEFCPGVHLQTLVAMPTEPFPAWNAAQAIVYNYINSALGLSAADIRDQYSNLCAPLASYQVLISVMPQATLSGATSADWISVVTQLNKELLAVIAVQSLFQQVTNFHLNMSQAQDISLSEAVTAAALPDQMNTKVQPKKKNKSWIGDLVEGLAYTAMNVAGTFIADPELGTELSTGEKFIKNGLPFLSNLMSTGFSSGSSFLQGQGNTPSSKNAAILANIYNYELTVWQMQQSLLTVFESANVALGQLEALILGDWGKLWGVYQMIQNPDGISSLYWPSFMAPSMAPQMLSGYTNGILQTLIPANSANKINATMHTNMGSPQGPVGLNADQVSFIENNADGTQNVYTTTCSQQVMQMIWANGASPLDFFHNLNGWSVPISYQNVASGENSSGPLAAGMIVRFRNNSAQALTLDLLAVNVMGNQNSFNSQQTIQYNLPAYGVQELAGCSYYIYQVVGPAQGGYVQQGTQGSFSIYTGSDTYVTGDFGFNQSDKIPSFNVSASGQSGYSAWVNLDHNYTSQGMYLFEVVITYGTVYPIVVSEISNPSPTSGLKAALPTGEPKAFVSTGESKASVPTGEPKASLPTGEPKASEPTGATQKDKEEQPLSPAEQLFAL
jgi:hypothetical protein